jgi:hypothetical protein
MLLFEKDGVILNVTYQNAVLTVQADKGTTDEKKTDQHIAASEETLARYYLKTKLSAVTLKDVKRHFLSRGWHLVKENNSL